MPEITEVASEVEISPEVETVVVDPAAEAAAMAALGTSSKNKGVCDIVFLIDATGSMSPAITDLKRNIKTFFNNLNNADANGGAVVKDWRARVIAYRDIDYDREWLIDNPFVRSVSEIEAQIDAIVAEGGGDEPESVLEALYHIAKFGSTPKKAQLEDATKWRYRSDAARVVILFTDASYHSKTSSSFEAPNLDWSEIANLIMQEKIRLSIFAPQMDCYDNLSQIDKCEWMPIEYDPSVPNDAVYRLRDFTADKANFTKVLEQLAKTVSVSAVAETL